MGHLAEGCVSPFQNSLLLFALSCPLQKTKCAFVLLIVIGVDGLRLVEVLLDRQTVWVVSVLGLPLKRLTMMRRATLQCMSGCLSALMTATSGRTRLAVFPSIALRRNEPVVCAVLEKALTCASGVHSLFGTAGTLERTGRLGRV